MTLDETYSRILQDIPEEKWEQANRILQCLFVSFRPLRVEELAEVLAIQFETEGVPNLITDWRLDDPEDALLSTCSSLIAIVQVNYSRVVEFSHFSVKEFLVSNRLSTSRDENVSRYHISPEPAHIILAQACLGTLLHLSDGVDRNQLKEYPLASYAAGKWVDHAQFENVSSFIQVGMDQLFDSSKPHFSTWIRIHDRDQSWVSRINEWPRYRLQYTSPPLGTPLYYAAGCGFHNLAKRLLTIYPRDVNTRGGHHGFPLCVASYMEHLDVLGLLLDHGAEINAKGYFGMTPLHAASKFGNLKAMKLLLENGADMDARNNDNDTPLGTASHFGNLGAVQLLVEHGADVNVHGKYGRTPLHHASWAYSSYISRDEDHNPEVVHFLLQHHADVGARDNDGKTALHLVSSNGRLKAAEFLLEYSADVNAYNNKQCTPLYYVSSLPRVFFKRYKGPSDGLEMARLLLKHGADVHTRNKYNETPLQVLLKKGKIEVAKLLMEYGAEE
jgi:ankyrin repeat protein